RAGAGFQGDGAFDAADSLRGPQEIGANLQAFHDERLAVRLAQGPLGRQLFAAGSAAAVQHLAAARGGHAGAEAVTALAHEFARLIGALHGSESSERTERAAVFRGRTRPSQPVWRVDIVFGV